MGRTVKAKSAETQSEQDIKSAVEQEQNTNTGNSKAIKTEEVVSDNIIALMKLYPQYEQFYVTSKGFVHPVGAPEYMRKDAKLYKNKYYKK